MMSFRNSWRACALSTLLLSATCFGGPLLNSLSINDNRIMELNGIFPVNGPVENEIQLQAAMLSNGYMLMIVLFKTPSGTQFLGGVGVIRGKGTDGAMVSIRGRNEGGYSIKSRATFIPEGSGRYELTGTILGPDINAAFTSTLQPTNPNRGIDIGDRQPVDDWGTWKCFYPEGTYETLTDISFSRPTGPSLLKITGETISLRLPGKLIPAGTVYGWETTPQVVRVKFGRASYQIPTSRISLLIDNPLGSL